MDGIDRFPFISIFYGKHFLNGIITILRPFPQSLPLPLSFMFPGVRIFNERNWMNGKAAHEGQNMKEIRIKF